MNPEMALAALAVLKVWRASAQAVVLHIIACPICTTSQECSLCDSLWDEELRCEATVIAMLPDLAAMGIDLRAELGDDFTFMTKYEA